MPVWSTEIKELEALFNSIKGRFPELEKDLEHLIKTDDENVALLYSRRCLEIIVTDLFDKELHRPRGNEPLKGIIDKLRHEKKVPSNIIASMEGLNTLSTFGTHPKEFDPEQVRPVIINLATIIKWYVKYKYSQVSIQVKPVEEEYYKKVSVEKKEVIQNSKKRLIFLFSGLLLVAAIIVALLFIYKIIGGSDETREIDKSIAVLPFKMLTDEPDKQYLADGMMDAILLHLAKIQDLHVMSRTSMEQYRVTNKTMPEIGREQGVEYLLEGSFQKSGYNVRLIVQLINARKDTHVWSNEYDRNWNDIFYVQSEVAQAIASELKAALTPQEKQLIGKTPTTSLTAYDFYQRGREEHIKYWNKNDNRIALENAENFYYEALQYDPAFAQAYTGLAQVYWDKHYWEDILSEDFMDSVMILCNIALTYDNQLSEAYTVRGKYFNETGKIEQAIKELNKAIEFNPNDWMAYQASGSIFSDYDLVKSIENYQKAISLNHGPQLPDLLRSISWPYFCAGFIEKTEYYCQEAVKLDKDSLKYYGNLVLYASDRGHFAEAVELNKKLISIDSNKIGYDFSFGMNYSLLGQFKEALTYFKKWLETKPETLSEADLFGLHRVGLAYWQNGYKEEAEYYFDRLIKYCDKLKKMGRNLPARAAYDLAAVYAFKGDTEKAYENLRIFIQSPISYQLWLISYLKLDPLFDSMRNEQEFQQIVTDQEARYEAEHERVRKWLEERNIGMVE